MTHTTATGMLLRDGKVLLGKRTSKIRYAGLWDCFGGHLESGESSSQALARELREELGIEPEDFEFVEVYEDVDPTSREVFRHHLYVVTRWNGELRIANDEHSEIRWFSFEELISVPMMPYLKQACMRELLSRKAKF